MYSIEQFVFHNGTTTTGTGTVYTNTKCDGLSILTTGTATSSIIKFEGMAVTDGVWLPIRGIKQEDYSDASETTLLNENWTFNISNFKKIRFNISAISGGNINIVGSLTAQTV